MNKYGIPSKFRIANHYYNVELCQFIDNGDSFGIHDNLKLLIQVAECMKEDESLAQTFANFMRELTQE